jgi:hypothetical protein
MSRRRQQAEEAQRRLETDEPTIKPKEALNLTVEDAGRLLEAAGGDSPVKCLPPGICGRDGEI